LNVLSMSVLALGSSSFAEGGFGHDLPEELVQVIFSHLSGKDLMNGAHVDQQCNSVAHKVDDEHREPYRRVDQATLIAKFGETAAKAMGQSFSRAMFGNSIIIGEPLKRSDGTEWKLDFRDANKTCLDLNPKNKIKSILKEVEEREQRLDALRKKYRLKLERVPDDLSDEEKAEFANILTKPISGCYLPSREELKILEPDLGSAKYSNILPKLGSRLFWSSSVSPWSTVNPWKDFKAYWSLHNPTRWDAFKAYSFYYSSRIGSSDFSDSINFHRSSRSALLHVRCACASAGEI
jgi:hypothetical protein